jgi:hypothetical protein
MNDPTWALTYGSFLYCHFHYHRLQLVCPLLALRLWRVANWSLFLIDCFLFHLVCPLVHVLSGLYTPTSAHLFPHLVWPSHKLKVSSTGNEEGPTKSWRIRGGLPISRFSRQEVLSHNRDRQLQQPQSEGRALSTTIRTTMTSQAIRCPCQGVIHQVISPVKAYKRIAENPRIFLSDNALNPHHNPHHNLHHSPLRREPPRPRRQRTTNHRPPSQITPGMHQARGIDALGGLPLHGRHPP